MAKFVKVMEWIVKDKLLDSVQVFQPTEPCYEAVTQVHTKDFVDSFIKGSLPFDENYAENRISLVSRPSEKMFSRSGYVIF